MELLYFVGVGAIAGFLAGKVMDLQAGLLTSVIIGIVGGFVGGWGLGLLGIAFGGMLGSIATAAIGAVVLLYVYKLIAS